jgi:hypothetical protein
VDFWIPLLGGALGAAIINGAFAFFKMKHDKLTEHEQWLRGQQVAAYAELIDSVKEARLWVASAYKTEDWKTRNHEGLAVMGTLKSGSLVLVAPPATLTAADDMINRLYDFAEAVSLHGYASSTPQFTALSENFQEKQRIFNARCRIDFRAPDWKSIDIGN